MLRSAVKRFDFFGQRPAFFGQPFMDLCFGIEIRASMSDEFDGLDATENARIGATLNRCRALATKIANELRDKRPEHFVDKSSLADVHASLEHAADVLSTVRGSQARGTSGRQAAGARPATAFGHDRPPGGSWQVLRAVYSLTRRSQQVYALTLRLRCGDVFLRQRLRDPKKRD